MQSGTITQYILFYLLIIVCGGGLLLLLILHSLGIIKDENDIR